jgi:predicted O-methyltransferase YrrM
VGNIEVGGIFGASSLWLENNCWKFWS